MSYGETLLYVWAHKRQIELFEALVSEQSFPLPPGERMQRERESITADIAKGAVIISTIEEKLALPHARPEQADGAYRAGTGSG